MDIKSFMSSFGFGHRRANHIIIDRGGELWIASAPVLSGGFIPPGGADLPGRLRIEPIANGTAAQFTYTVTESLLELTTSAGSQIKFAIDPDAQAIRIAGSTALRLNGIEDTAGTASLNTPEGAAVKFGGIRYLFTAVRGKMSFNDTWLLHKRHSDTPIIDILPENGAFELYAFHLPDDSDIPAVAGALEQRAEDNSAEFRDFIDGLVDIPAEWSDVKEKIAYPIWLCHRVLDGEGSEVIVSNKYNSRNTNSRLMSIASMAFKDARKAIDMLLSRPAELPPVMCIAAARLLSDRMLNDSRGYIYEVYSALDEIVRKCISGRTTEKTGLCFYAYRFEAGEETAPEFFDAGEPVFAPDLNTYMVIAADVLSQLANMEYDVGQGRKWALYSRELCSKLIAGLWDGENFIGRSAYNGEASEPDNTLSLIPILLGSRLPDEIVGKLTPRINADIGGSVTGLLIAGGLFDSGGTASARAIALNALERVRSDGIECPFRGAALLALAHKVL